MSDSEAGWSVVEDHADLTEEEQLFGTNSQREREEAGAPSSSSQPPTPTKAGRGGADGAAVPGPGAPRVLPLDQGQPVHAHRLPLHPRVPRRLERVSARAHCRGIRLVGRDLQSSR